MGEHQRKFPTVPAGAAQSVAGPTKYGFRDATVTSGGEQTLTMPDSWIGHYVYIYAETADIFCHFAETPSQTMVLTAISAPGRAPLKIFKDQFGRDVVVPDKYLRYKSESGTGKLTVIRS